MFRRFPLYLKILGWFFLNLLLLAAVFFAIGRAQFRFGLDLFLSNRVESVSSIIAAELGSVPPSAWGITLRRFASGYDNKVRFLAFGGDGVLLAGDPMTIPDEVRQQLEHHGGRPPDRGMDDGPGPLPDAPPPRLAPRPPREFIHTSHPSQYWVIRRVPVQQPGHNHPTPLTLVAVSDTFSAGGLFFDGTPLLALGLGGMFLSVLLWFPFVHNMTRSIRQMTAAANQIAEGHFDARVDQHRRDELGSLGHAINQMAVRLHELVAGQKRFLGDVAHELCSPLAKLRVSLGILDQQASEAQKPYLAGAEDEATHMANLVNELLSFSKASLAASPIRLQAVRVRDLAEQAARRECDSSTQLAVSVPEDLLVMADPELLTRALSNLLRNAVRYASSAGPILLEAKLEGGDVLIEVADSGPGVPEEELARIFDPFYRVDPSRDRATGGVGLGLAIVKTCVESCGGSVTGGNRSPAGLAITIRLKAATPV